MIEKHCQNCAFLDRCEEVCDESAVYSAFIETVNSVGHYYPDTSDDVIDEMVDEFYIRCVLAENEGRDFSLVEEIVEDINKGK